MRTLPFLKSVKNVFQPSIPQAQDGIPLPKLRLIDSRRAIGFVQQEPILFDRTIGENIAYGNNEIMPSADDVIEAAKQANIHNFITSLPLVRRDFIFVLIFGVCNAQKWVMASFKVPNLLNVSMAWQGRGIV